jgi:hypothetical protein
MKMNARQTSYCLIVYAVALYFTTTATASQYADYSHRPLSEMLEVYSRFEANLQTGSNYNVGAAAALMAAIGKKGGREVFPFLEEKILAPVTPAFVRSAAAEIYASLATAEECAEFLPKILKVDDEDKTIISWRYTVTPACLNKVEAAIAQNEMSRETLARLVDALVMYTQFAYSASEARHVDDFLLRHCEGYSTSWQRLALWTKILDADKENEVKREKCLPIKQSIEAVPPKQRTDLRKRFPDLPPLPGGAPTGIPLKVALGIGAAFIAVCVAIWIMARHRKP